MTERWKSKHLKIHACELQDIGCLGPLPKKYNANATSDAHRLTLHPLAERQLIRFRVDVVLRSEGTIVFMSELILDWRSLENAANFAVCLSRHFDVIP